MKEMNTIGIQSFMTAFMLNIPNILKICISNSEQLMRSQVNKKLTSSPSLVLHLGELDDKPKEYFERTKKEVSHKNILAKWVHQHKMQNVNMSVGKRRVDQEYQKFERKQN